jgi:hypothetical protein
MRSSRVATVTVLAATALAGCPFITSGEGVGFVGPTGSGGGASSSGGPSTSSSGGGATSSSSGQTGCTLGDTHDCYTGTPVTSEMFGTCHSGTATCAADGGFGPCTGDVTPQPDNCASLLNSHCDSKELLCSGTVDQAQSHAWGELGDDRGLGIAIDGNGNTIVGGFFNGTLDFGGGNKTTTDAGSDAFVASYSPTGTLNWMTQLGDTGPDQVTALVVDGSGNVFVTGNFDNKLTFASPSTVSPITNGAGLFVAKLDNAGTVKWAKGFVGDAGAHVAQAIAISTDGSLLAVAGHTAGMLTVGGTIVATQNTNDSDGLVFTMDSAAGNVTWVRQVKEDGQTSMQALNGVAIASDKSVVVAGTGEGNVDFGVGSPVPMPGNKTNVAIAKYNADGAGTAWAQLIGANNDLQVANAVAVGSNDDVFVTGQFQKQLAFGTVMLEDGDAGANNNAIFVARLDKMGVAKWAQSFSPTMAPAGGPLDASGLGIAADAYGVVVGGYFSNALQVGPDTLTTKDKDALAMKLAVMDGSVLWSQQFGSTGDDQINAVTLDPRNQNPLGGSAVVGIFTSQILLNSNFVQGKGSFDIFFARLAP